MVATREAEVPSRPRLRSAAIVRDRSNGGPSRLRWTAREGARRLLERSPALYLRWFDWRVDHPTPLGPDTELVVGGFPGSANSYVRSWIQFANPELRIASHQHSSAVIAVAARRGVPMLVPYREPVDAVTSMLVRFPHYRSAPPYGAAALLRWYVRYHEVVLTHREALVLVSFEEATADLTGTVEQVNRRFVRRFATLDEEHWPRVLEYLATKDGDQTSVSVPSETKHAAKATHRSVVDAVGAARERAERLHEALRAAEAQQSPR